MNKATHVIDPDGEVLIILRNANDSFAVWDEMPSFPLPESNHGRHSNSDTEAWNEHVDSSCLTQKEKRKRKKTRKQKANKGKFGDLGAPSSTLQKFFNSTSQPIEEPPVEEPPVEEPPVEEPPVEEPPVEEPPVEEPPVEEPPVEEPPVEVPSVEESMKNMSLIIQSDETSNHLFLDASNIENENRNLDVTQIYCDHDSPEDCYRIQVSAKHLTLASPVFKKTFTGGWKESVNFLESCSVEITMDGWDLETLLILLRIIHCQHYIVPRKLGLELLAKVTVLSDYYDCQAAVKFFTDIWVAPLEDTIPKFYTRDLILWVWISWFFELPKQFKEATSVAMSQSTGSIIDLGLPIPNRVLETMNDFRQKAIKNRITQLHERRESFLKGD
ncbi:uncharacterized protein BDCG_17032 [Blastomyces dermatitidis ER-3]|uniref:BTB domain-containing protein n=1 Tax=Ajellomyces dermatitidis (strain ER-3 / ATCC MYA-2586) TaxID=559297 RepID=A0ABX2VVX7_AJEDR|nr:uncharacterized protein BDCG_17032 [Blastomyces dermatitidis ER-3]OAT01315.1 hypothetical protein BDCG_17032 [Blastomyces dermatitidis ER-3]